MPFHRKRQFINFDVTIQDLRLGCFFGGNASVEGAAEPQSGLYMSPRAQHIVSVPVKLNQSEGLEANSAVTAQLRSGTIKNKIEIRDRVCVSGCIRLSESDDNAAQVR